MSELSQPLVQIAYFVTDAQLAAQRAVIEFGAGPFFFVPRIELAWGEHRGRPQLFLHSSAYGQWGNLMLEFVQQDEAGPSPFRDMYQPGQEGIHHMAMMVDSLSEAYREVARQGHALAAKAMTRTGTEFAFVDRVASHGHMLEIYESSAALKGFYQMVADAALDWDGRESIRSLG